MATASASQHGLDGRTVALVASTRSRHMTQPARHALPPPADIGDALQRIRDHGGRVTAGKRALVHLLYDDDDASFTLDDITAQMVDHDRSTIYRMLNQFEELGIAEHLHLGHGQAVHRAAGRATVPVVCSVCGRGIDLERARTRSFVRLVAERTGITLDLSHFPLTGTCEECAGRRSDAAMRSPDAPRGSRRA